MKKGDISSNSYSHPSQKLKHTIQNEEDVVLLSLFFSGILVYGALSKKQFHPLVRPVAGQISVSSPCLMSGNFSSFFLLKYLNSLRPIISRSWSTRHVSMMSWSRDISPYPTAEARPSIRRVLGKNFFQTSKHRCSFPENLHSKRAKNLLDFVLRVSHFLR